MSEFVFKDNSKEVISEEQRIKKLALWAIGAAAEGYAKKKTPVDTGRLRNSITHAEKDDSTYIGTNVEYAPYIELGARGRKGHHMLKQAATGHSSEYKDIAKKFFES